MKLTGAQFVARVRQVAREIALYDAYCLSLLNGDDQATYDAWAARVSRTADRQYAAYRADMATYLPEAMCRPL